MARSKAICGVLANFLGTYASRYSSYDGFWLFGFLVRDLTEIRIDLLAPPPSEAGSPVGTAVRFAVVKFEDQMRKAGVIHAQVREASLVIRMLPDVVEGTINGVRCVGCNVSLLAHALTQSGRQHERERILFVAPHNPQVEHRSG